MIIPLTPNAIKYVINHLFLVAWKDVLNEISICVADDRCSATATVRGKKITFKISEQTHIDELIQGKASLSKIDTADGRYSIPISLENNLPFAEIKDNELCINADIISLSFIMLTRYEEKVINERDIFGRFESKNSIAVKYNFIDFPIVDEYAMILQIYLKKLFSEENFTTSECKIIPTHDVDEPLRFDGPINTLKNILRCIYLYKNLSMFFSAVWQYFQLVSNRKKDPYLETIYELATISKKYNLKSEFYFMGAVPGCIDYGYEIETPHVLNTISFIQQQGMIIGFHGGYDLNTSTNSEQFTKEKKRIEDATIQKIIGGRQHYLAFDINSSFKVWEECDMKYDSTLGYAEREGFRCGTCYEYSLYDFENDKEYTVKERPLIVMDGTLCKDRKLKTDEAYNQMVKLYLRCQFVGGNFVILWHNSFSAKRPNWFKKVYYRFFGNFCK